VEAVTIEIGTIEELRNHAYSVGTWCPKCSYRGPTLDLDKYIRQGRGGMRPIDLGLKHATCRTLLQLTISPPKGYGK
jgi:hypothetical protein